MLKWIKKLRLIVSGYDSDLRNAHARIADLEKLIRDRTDIYVDVGLHGYCQVVVLGHYKNVDLVQTYSIDTPSFAALVEQLRQMERYGRVRRIDAPPSMKHIFKRGAVDGW